MVASEIVLASPSIVLAVLLTWLVTSPLVTSLNPDSRVKVSNATPIAFL